MIRYFAHGSNMSQEKLEGHGIVVRGRSAGRLHGWRLVFNISEDWYLPHVWANIEESPGSVVEGVIYELEDSSLACLDDHENVYRRVVLEVTGGDGSPIMCQTYVGKAEFKYDNLTPRKDYIDLLLKGRDYLSPTYIEFLESFYE